MWREDKISFEVHDYVRPIRLAFLIRPDDAASFKRCIQYNTSVWGGVLNVFVPLIGKRPAWWTGPIPKPFRRGVVEGYLEVFEPDVLVETKPGQLKELGIDAGVRDSLTLSTLLSRLGQFDGIGLTAYEVCRALYERELKFVPRDPVSAMKPELSRRSAFPALQRVLFGEYPATHRDSLERAYDDVFEPGIRKVTPTSLLAEYPSSAISPLKAGLQFLEYYGGREYAKDLLLLDTRQTVDLIWFWNLRAAGKLVRPVPVEHLKELLPTLNKLVARSVGKHPFNKNIDIFPTLVRAPSISMSRYKSGDQLLRQGGCTGYAIQNWAPYFHDVEFADTQGFRRCRFRLGNDYRHIYSEPDSLTIPFPAIPFGTAVSEKRWTHVVGLRTQFYEGDRASVIPPDLKDVDKAFDLFRKNARVTSDGIAYVAGSDMDLRLSPPTGRSVLSRYFAEQGFEVSQSSGGNTSELVLALLRGPTGLQHIAHPRTVKLLEAMSSGQVEQEASLPGAKKKGKTASFKEWDQVLRNTRGHESRAQASLHRLTHRGVLKLGLKLRCERCRQGNWYPVEQLQEVLSCEHCLADLEFPLESPPTDAWAYRTRGPFAVPGFARGAYSAAFALGFFTHLTTVRLSWGFGIELQRGNKKREADLVALLDYGLGLSPATVFLEAKSFRPFKDEDFRRAADLQCWFPGSYIGFGTLRDALDVSEKTKLKALRKRCKHGPSGEVRLFVLTATELFSDHGAPGCWRAGKAKKMKAVDSFAYHRALSGLCEVTQALYL